VPDVDPELWILVHGGVPECMEHVYQVTCPAEVRAFIQSLYRQAAKKIAPHADVRADATVGEGAENGAYVEAWVRVDEEMEGDDEYRSAVRQSELWGGQVVGDVEINEDAFVELDADEDGAWVQGWVWVSHTALEEEWDGRRS